jgi:hypothetical protein
VLDARQALGANGLPRGLQIGCLQGSEEQLREVGFTVSAVLDFALKLLTDAAEFLIFQVDQE